MGVVGAVVHFWFVTAPTGIWDALTPLSIAKAAVMACAYIAYGVVTLAVIALVLAVPVRVVAAWSRGLIKGIRQGSKGSSGS